MAKSAKPVAPVAPVAPSLAASKKAAKAPSKAVVTRPAAPGPIAALAAALVAPAAPVVAPKAPSAVPTRTHGAVQAVKLGAKTYRVKAGHNAETWAAITAALAGGPASVEVVAKAAEKHTGGSGAVGFIGYCVRRGYLAVADKA